MPQHDIEKIVSAGSSSQETVYEIEPVAILESGKSAEGTAVLADDVKRIESKAETFKPSEVLLEQGYVAHSGAKQAPTREAYLSVVACFLVTFCTFSTGFVAPTFIGYYKATLLPEYTVSSLSWICTIGFTLQLMLSAPAGLLFDRGYGRISIFLSSIMFSFSYFMLSLCTEYWQIFLAQGVGVGLSLVCLFLPVYGSVCLYFANCRGATLAIGIAFAGGSLGGVVLPIALNRLVPMIGFAWATRVYALICTVCLAVANLILTPFDPSKLPQDPNMKVATTRDLLRDWRYMATVGAGCALMFGSLGPFQTIQVFAVNATDVGIEFSRYLPSILNGCGLLFLGLNALADRYGAFTVLTPLMLMGAILAFCLPSCTTKAKLIAFCVFYGVVVNGMTPLFSPTIASLSANQKDFGFRSGWAWTVIAFFAVSGVPAVSGVVGDNNWMGGMALAGCIMLLCALLLGIVHRSLWKEKGTWRV